MMNKIISYFLFIRFIFLILITGFFTLIAGCFFWLRFISNIDYYFMKYWAKSVLFIYGIKVTKDNRKKDTGIYVAPHSSFWDILVLASSIKGFFVSKAEVFKWPIIGLGAKMVRTIFIERTHGVRSLKLMAKKAKDVFKANSSVIVFPEGTRTYDHFRPFKMGAFNISYETKYPIIPVMVNYIPKDTIISKEKKSFILELINQAMYLRRQEVNLMFLDNVNPKDFSNVRELKDNVYNLMSRKALS